MAYPHETDDAGVVTKKNVNADNQAGEPEKAQAVTGRANDTPMTSEKPAIANSTFAERAKAAKKPAAKKAVDDDTAENKTMSSTRTRKK